MPDPVAVGPLAVEDFDGVEVLLEDHVNIELEVVELFVKDSGMRGRRPAESPTGSRIKIDLRGLTLVQAKRSSTRAGKTGAPREGAAEEPACSSYGTVATAHTPVGISRSGCPGAMNYPGLIRTGGEVVPACISRGHSHARHALLLRSSAAPPRPRKG